MKSPAMRYTGICVLVLLLSFSVTGCATYRTHPDFKERQKSIAKIAVMAPQVDSYMLTFKGDKNRLDFVGAIMEKAMVDGMEYTFSQKGYEIKKLDVGPSALAQNPEFKTAVFNINQLFDKALGDIKKGKQKTFTYSVGSDINRFADMSGSDAIIFMRGLGLEKSDGEITKEVIKSVAIAVAGAMVGVAYTPSIQVSSVVMDVAVIDANDGAILWYNYNNEVASNYSPRNNRQVSDLTRSLVLAFPESAERQAAKKKTVPKRISSNVRGTREMPAVPAITPPVAR